jgi:hypothetical protein
LHDANEAADGGCVFYRRAAELHHHHIIASLESALSLYSAHNVTFLGAKKNPPPDCFWRWVRVVLLRLLYFIRSRPPEDT